MNTFTNWCFIFTFHFIYFNIFKNKIYLTLNSLKKLQSDSSVTAVRIFLCERAQTNFCNLVLSIFTQCAIRSASVFLALITDTGSASLEPLQKTI